MGCRPHHPPGGAAVGSDRRRSPSAATACGHQGTSADEHRMYEIGRTTANGAVTPRPSCVFSSTVSARICKSRSSMPSHRMRTTAKSQGSHALPSSDRLSSSGLRNHRTDRPDSGRRDALGRRAPSIAYRWGERCLVAQVLGEQRLTPVVTTDTYVRSDRNPSPFIFIPLTPIISTSLGRWSAQHSS